MGIEAALIGGGLGLLGGVMSSNSASNAAAQSSAAQIEAARIAAEASKFKPIGTTTRFGSSQYGYGTGGELTSAGYTVAPDIAAMRESAIGQAGGYLGQAGGGMAATAPAFGAAQGMFSLGQQFMPTSAAYSASPEAQAYAAQLRGISGQVLPSSYTPQVSPESQAYSQQLRGLAGQVLPSSYDTTAAAQQYMQQQQALLQPGREQSYAALQQQLQNTGRGGFSVAQGGALGAANPEMQAYYNAIAQSDAALAANAQQQARSNLQQDITFGTGLSRAALTEQQQAAQQARANLQGDITFGTGLSGQALTSQQNAEAIARQGLLGNIQAGTALTTGGLSTLSGAYGAQQQAYSPYTTAMGAATGLEGFGAGAYDMSNAMAGRTTGANQIGASGMLSAQNAAAQRGYAVNAQSPWSTAFAGAASNPQLVSGIQNWLSPQTTPTDMTGFQQPYSAPAYQVTQPTMGSGLWLP